MHTTRIGYVRIPPDDERSVFEVEEDDARIDGPYVADEDAAALVSTAHTVKAPCRRWPENIGMLRTAGNW